ncbi:MAG: hypothetical protein P4M11_12950 [Candidatus Pacebacteria bacterium]|nr:hypothetical protein [Candidatus Paceibacterota bacterium]
MLELKLRGSLGAEDAALATINEMKFTEVKGEIGPEPISWGQSRSDIIISNEELTRILDEQVLPAKNAKGSTSMGKKSPDSDCHQEVDELSEPSAKKRIGSKSRSKAKGRGRVMLCKNIK